MTQNEITRMAREAGLSVGTNISGIELVGSPAEIGLNHLTIDELKRFAALVAAYIRETEFKPDWNNYRQGLVDGAAAERERCALVCEAEAEKWEGDDGPICAEARLCAVAIRARGGDQ